MVEIKEKEFICTPNILILSQRENSLECSFSNVEYFYFFKRVNGESMLSLDQFLGITLCKPVVWIVVQE